MQFFRSIGLDIKSAISILGLSIRYLFNQKDSNSPIIMFGEQNTDLYDSTKHSCCYFHSHCCTKCPVGVAQNVERDAINRENTMSSI